MAAARTKPFVHNLRKHGVKDDWQPSTLALRIAGLRGIDDAERRKDEPRFEGAWASQLCGKAGLRLGKF